MSTSIRMSRLAYLVEVNYDIVKGGIVRTASVNMDNTDLENSTPGKEIKASL